MQKCRGELWNKHWALVAGISLALFLYGCADREPQKTEITEVAYQEIPLGDTELPPGPNRDLLVMSCMSCHSPAYITMQPPFPRKVWEAEVTKMVNVFGAQVRPYDRKLIVDYLMTIRGNPPRKTTI